MVEAVVVDKLAESGFDFWQSSRLLECRCRKLLVLGLVYLASEILSYRGLGRTRHAVDPPHG